MHEDFVSEFSAKLVSFKGHVAQVNIGALHALHLDCCVIGPIVHVDVHDVEQRSLHVRPQGYHAVRLVAGIAVHKVGLELHFAVLDVADSSDLLGVLVLHDLVFILPPAGARAQSCRSDLVVQSLFLVA